MDRLWKIGMAHGVGYLAQYVAVLVAVALLPAPVLAQTFAEIGVIAGVRDSGAVFGVAWGDYDNDGYQDLYMTDESRPCRLYHNNGNGTFTEVGSSAGVANADAGRGVAWGDYNNDGKLDLYVSNNRSVNKLYRNNGNGTFTDVAGAAGMVDAGSGSGVAWGDYDNDGNLDLYRVNYGSANKLYHNNGNGTFTEVGSSTGVPDAGNGLGVAWGDYDNDGDLDLFLTIESSPNKLYRNNGNGTFTEVGNSAGVAAAVNGRGVAWGDYDNDGDLDLYVSRGPSQPSLLYRNNGDGTFTEVAASAGVANVGNGFGVAWGDYDNDGDLDLFLANNGSASRLYRNNGDGTFTEVAASSGVVNAGNGFGVAWGDYNNDGSLDFYLANYSLPSRLFKNNGNSSRWLTVKLAGAISNRSGIGARVVAVTGSMRQRRDVDGGSGYLSQPSLPVEFGFGGTTTVDSLIVRWPSGITQTLTGVSTNQVLTLTEAQSPGIALSSLSLSFGNVEKGLSSQQSLRIKNTGSAVLSISSITTNIPFAPSSTGPLSINPGDSTTMTVTFSPTVTGTRTDTLRITHNGAGSPSRVVLTGTGVASPGPTNVGGVISTQTTWALAGNPYIVTDNILVNNGVTLTVEPGVIVRVNSGKVLQVNGTLIARGAPGSRITFTSNQNSPTAGNWGGITFSDASSDATYDASGAYAGGSALEQVVVEYGGGSGTGAVQVASASPLIRGCSIRNNNAGINVVSGAPRIDGSTISNNLSYGIQVDGPGSIASVVGDTVTNNTRDGIAVVGWNYTSGEILNNLVMDNGGNGVIITVGAARDTLQGNTVLRNGAWGVYINGDATVIQNRIILNRGGGLFMDSLMEAVYNIIADNAGRGYSASIFSPHLRYNTIARNTGDYPVYYGAYNGIRDVTYNTIAQNRSTAASNPTTVFLHKGSSGVPRLANNNFTGNTSTYLVANDYSSTTTLDAKNNWWGTPSETAIREAIFDFSDDGTKAPVSYSPYLSLPDTAAPVSPPGNVIKSAVAGGVQLTWAANPEGDLAGYRVYSGSPTGYSFARSVTVGRVTSYTLSGVSISDTVAVTALDTQADGVNDQIEGHESWFAAASVKADTARPAIALSPTSLSFGDVRVGSSGVQTLTISNIGTALLTVGTITSTNPLFKVVQKPLNLAPSAIGTVNVTFAPSAVGPQDGKLNLFHNAADGFSTVDLSGRGVDTVSVSGVQVSAGQVRMLRGATVAVPISVNDAKGIAGADFTVTYDATALTAKQVKPESLLVAAGITLVPNLTTAGQARVSMAGATGIPSGKGPLFSITFETRTDTREGTYPLTLQASLKDGVGRTIPSTSVSGSVTVVVGVFGDVNDDNLVDAGDAVLVLRYSAGLIPPVFTDRQKDLGDVNGDGFVDAGDAVLILRRSVGLISKFPREGAGKPVVLAGEQGNRGAGVRFGEVRGQGLTVEVPVVLGAGVYGGDLTLKYDAAAFSSAQARGSDGMVVALNADRLGEVRMSVARTDAEGEGIVWVALTLARGPHPASLSLGAPLPSYGRGGGGEGLSPYIRLTGQAFGAGGWPLGEVNQILDRPLKSSLSVAYPNPFNPSTTLQYEIGEVGEVRLTVYSLTGQVVRRLVSGWQGAGRYAVVWDGRDDAGRVVATGLYLSHLDAGVFHQTQKMLLVK